MDVHLANEASLIGLRNRLLHDHRLVHKLATDVDVRGRCAHGDAGDEATLDQFVWIVPHDFPVLARTGL